MADGVPNKGKSAIPHLYNDLKVLSSASDKAKLFREIFSQNSNFNVSFISLFFSNRRPPVVLHGKRFQEYLDNASVFQGLTISSTLFLLYINYLFGEDICNILIYVADATLYSKDNHPPN